MKRALLAAALTIAGVVPALAGDPYPSRVRVSYPRSPAQVFAWQGAYIGVGIGERWTEAAWTTTDVAAGFTVADDTARERLSSRGFRTSFYTGYNWQSDNWVWGVEGDVGLGRSRRGVSDLPGTYLASQLTGADELAIRSGTDGSFRLRAGVLVSRTALLYMTGGLALMQSQWSASCNAAVSNWCETVSRSESVSKVLAGFTGGTGIELLLHDHWLLRGEYRYTSFGRPGHEFFRKTGVDEFSGNAFITTHIMTFGLGYKF